MKRFNKSFLKVFALIIIISLLSACGSKSSKDQISDGDFGAPNKVEDMTAGESGTANKGDAGALVGEKVISTYYMNLETLEFEKSKDALDNLIEKYKAFVDNSNINFTGYEYNKNYRFGDFSIRIPKDNVDKFKMEIRELGNITNESTSIEDVTTF